MIQPTSSRIDGSVAAITIVLDNINTEYLKKYHCAVCGHVVFGYYDTILMLIPSDTVTGQLKKMKNATSELVCLNRWVDAKGHTERCKTVYILSRG